MSVDSNKVYFGYTPYIPKNLAEMHGFEASRATIALKIEGRTVKYGISVCSHNDNFCKKEGRKLAEDRLTNEPESFEIPEHIARDLRFRDSHDLSLYFLRNMIQSTSYRRKIKKTQRKLGKKQPRRPFLLSPVKETDTTKST